MQTHDTVTLRREPGPLVRSLVALTLRLALGLIFLMSGLAKLEDSKSGKYPGGMVKSFETSRLRPDMVRLFARVLPYAEVTLGGALIAGLFTTLTATLSGILLAHLLFGQTVLGHAEAYPGMLAYFLVNAGILWLSPITSNYFSVDGLLLGWFWAPRSEATYRREDADKPAPRRV